MEYKVNSPKLQDIETKTVELYATAAELGELDSGNLEIAVADIQSDLEATDVIVATNLSISSEALTPTVTDGVLTLDGTSAISAANKIHLVIRLK